MYEISKFSTVNIREYLAESKDAEIGDGLWKHQPDDGADP